MLPNSAFYLNLIGGLAPEKRARRVESNIPSHTTWGPHGMWGCCKKSEILICFFLRTSWWAWFARYRWPLRALAHFPNFGDTLDRKNGLFDCYIVLNRTPHCLVMRDLVLSDSANYMTHDAGLRHQTTKKKKRKRKKKRKKCFLPTVSQRLL